MIVIPMVGRSSRFFKEGFSVPKYELCLFGEPVLAWVLRSFQAYYESQKFLFVTREDFNASGFVTEVVKKEGIRDFEIVELDFETEGQAHSVAIGLERMQKSDDAGPLVIFNADSMLLNFSIPDRRHIGAGVLDVFRGEGDHWSFVEPASGSRVLRTAEKTRISEFCSNGLYIFANSELFLDSFRAFFDSNLTEKGEYYIAPLYNHLIGQNLPVYFRQVPESDCVFCGTPSEFQALLDVGDQLELPGRYPVEH
ncbi:hypothetical protein HMPREF2785_01005 [Corynebacterium sp. HMSC067D03]|uniref:hypothetical protein n=1 Tax=unclassified Corynebacterium TaxID=2624378 RepID=UPI0008A300AC|nr:MULTISPECIES: hypothetical protein [unclassified Corynebacterium]OFL18275.1 hypothetical protein HMPREF2785_01005 [Corynebacterium sp. HMSC067D03]OFO34318.1 hypothetical protein HMPREF3048_02445 [Corynebacterium sp. HMSC075D04]